MTDNKEKAPTPEITPEQATVIRNHMYNGLNKEYQEFVNTMRSLPIHQPSLQYAYQFLDTGMLWAKEVIFFAPFVNPPIPLVPAAADVVTPTESEDAVS